MTSSKTRIQNYLRQNKISELFEEMMGKLVRDLPASPIYYLVNFLQDKEKKIKQITRQESAGTKEKKLELSSNAMLWATAPAPVKKPTSPRSSSSQPNQQSSPDARKYEKPWLTHSKKSPAKSKSGGKLNQTAPADVSKSEKLEWNQKTKMSERDGDVVDGDDLDLGLVYAKPKIVGETHIKVKSEEEEMADEFALSGKYSTQEDNTNLPDSMASKSSKVSAKEAKRRRQEELRRLAESTHSKSETRSVSPIEGDNDSEVDDALEVLEDADELKNEGVKDPPKSGVIIGHSAQKGKEEIELVLNMKKFFDELGGMEGISQSHINGSDVASRLADDDEDFESASQVTGPRRPVWEAPDSEIESVASQLRSARLSGIGVDSFVTKPESVSKPKQEPKVETPKRKNSEQRPRTAPSRSRSNVDLNLSNGHESPQKSVKSPRSRPTTPRGSVVGSGRASRRVSQSSKVSESAKKEKEKSKKTPEQEDDEPDTKPKET